LSDISCDEDTIKQSKNWFWKVVCYNYKSSSEMEQIYNTEVVVENVIKQQEQDIEKKITKSKPLIDIPYKYIGLKDKEFRHEKL